MNPNTLILTGLAFVVAALATPFQLFRLPLAPLAALVIGGVGGWQAAARGEGTGCGVRAGAVTGLGALFGAVLGLVDLAASTLGRLLAGVAYGIRSEAAPGAPSSRKV